MSSTPARNHGKTPKRTPMRKERMVYKDQDPVEVYCRVKPLSDDEEESCVDVVSNEIIQLNPPKFSRAVSKYESVQCTFKHIFTEDTSQKNVFDNIGLPLVNDLLNGKNGLIFMYGITGSGKTFTMNGSPSNAGMLPRCLDVLFNSIYDVQTERCIFKPDNYNGFDVLSDSEAKSERERKDKEAALIHHRARKDNEVADMVRIPDQTKLDVDEDNSYSVFISYVEIYNNFIYDLLEEVQSDKVCPKAPVSKILREDSDKNMYVYGGTEVEVKTTEEAYEVFWKGQSRRRVAHTQLNAESSRSHSVFTIKLVQAPLDSTGQQIIRDKNQIAVSQLSLCDLAGSERSKRTENGGDRLREAGNINSSLMTLRTCIEALRENQKAYENGGRLQIVPYRDSKLTHLFKRHFDGEGKVRMVVCLNPSPGDFDESLHVMRFSEVTQEVKVARSEGAKFDLGLTPGRGKANRFYKQVIQDLEKVKEESAAAEILPIRTLQRFEAFPSLELASAEDSTTLVNIISYLQKRMTLRNTLLREQNQREENLRAQILNLQQENDDFCRALADQKSVFTDKDREIQSLEKRIKSLHQKIENSQRTVTTLEREKRTLEVESEKYKKAYEKERQDKLRAKQMLKDLSSNHKSRLELECNRRVKDKQLEMEGKVYEKQEKLRQLREIVQNFESPIRNQIEVQIPLDDDEAPAMPQPTQKPAEEPVVHHHHHHHHSRQSRATEKKMPPPVAKKPVRFRSRTVTSENKIRSKSPPATLKRNDRREPPIRARHRRSRSSDCILMHKPTGTLATDTIMQPVVKNKKTVNVPRMSDLKDPVNYMLTHQEEDSAGEVETKLIKGQVMKTRTGGHSVQFTDIETLKHRFENRNPSGQETSAKDTESSGTETTTGRGRKRQSESEAEVRSDDSMTEVETRCAVGVGGGPHPEQSLTHQAKRRKP